MNENYFKEASKIFGAPSEEVAITITESLNKKMFKDLDIDAVINHEEKRLFISVDYDRGVMAEIHKDDVYKLMEFFGIEEQGPEDEST